MGQQIQDELNAEVESGRIYCTFNHQNTKLICSVAKRDQLEKPTFITDYWQRNPAVYKKQIPLPNIDKVIEAGTANSVWSKIDLADSNFNIVVQEISEKFNIIKNTYSKIGNWRTLQKDYNCNAMPVLD